MADISLTRKHGFEDPEDVRSRIEGLADRLADRLGGSWRWKGDEAVCEARGAKACVGYTREEISIVISLPLVLRPLRGRLESKIDEYYERYFGRG